ncbi:MAG: protein kinase, partial [Acidimicrobiia bacterium]|nr:protein kinase [Acidimicrobiia bacterium]
TMAVTFGYTAPEVLDDERPTPASDIYSLAMTIFRLIQGLHAYHADTPAAVMRKVLSDPDRPQLSAGVPPGVAAVVADGLAKDPAARPASALDMARRLQHVQVDNGLPPTPVVVADEPAVDIDKPLRPDPRETGAGLEVEDAIVAVVRQRQRQRQRQPRVVDPGASVDDVGTASGPGSPGRPERADVGRILADAIVASSAEPGRRPRRAVDSAGSPPRQEQATPLDLPTVVTPRRPRDDVDLEPRADAVDNRRRWMIGLAILTAVLAIVALAILGVWPR